MKPSIKTPLWSIVTISSLILLASCSKSWLKPDPLSFFTPSNTYINETGFQSLLVTMRKDLTEDYYGNRNPIAGEYAASDLAVITFELDWKKITPSSDQFWKYLSLFTTAYTNIKDANTVVSRINDIKWDNQADQNAVLAEAYWHRAYWYYRLVNSYGDVPWIGGEVKGAVLNFETYSRWTILDKLKKDLEFAVQWLPVKAVPGAITRGAANMLLAKVALTDCDFDEAIKATTDVINGPYALMESRFGSQASDTSLNVIWDLHRPENINIPQNTETILAMVDRPNAPTAARTAGTYTMRMYNCAFYNSVVKDSIGGPGTISTGGEYDTLGRGNPDVRLDAFYEYGLWQYGNQTYKNTPDLRRANGNWIDINEVYYNNPASPNYGEPLNPKWFASVSDTFQALYAQPIYFTYVPQNVGGTPAGGNGDMYIFRLAGAYLLRAEAEYWKGEDALASQDINMVRERAHATPITPNEVTIDFIMDERARELFGEEPRHDELVRASYIMAKLGIDGYSLSDFPQKNYYYDRVMKDNIFYSQNISFYNNSSFIAPYNVLYPIPTSVIVANTLGHINQNVGYVGYQSNVPPITTPIQ